MSQTRCPHPHAILKADPILFAALDYVGVLKDDDDNPELELRNCPCGSTISRRILSTK